MKKRIVAEITRNWYGTENERLEKPLVSQQFEEVIRVNAERGFELESWQFKQLPPLAGADRPCMLETILAVFVER